MNKQKYLTSLHGKQAAMRVAQLIHLLKKDHVTRKKKRHIIDILGNFIDSKAAKQALLSLLDHEDSWLRFYAMEALQNFDGSDLYEAAISKINDPNHLVRISSVEMLGYLERKEAIPALIGALRDKHELVQCYAAESLGDIGDHSVIPSLEEQLLIEKSSVARVGLLFALCDLGQRQYFVDLLKLLEDESETARARIAAILWFLATDENREDMVLALNNRHKQEKTKRVQTLIEESLHSIEEKTTLNSIKRLDEDPDTDNAKQQLISFTEHNDDKIRLCALQTLRFFEEDSELYAAALHGVADTNELIRAASAELLGYTAQEKAISTLLRMLKDDHETVRCSAAEALGDIGNERVIPSLTYRLQRETATVARSGLLFALCALNEMEYFVELVSLLEDENHETRWRTARFLPCFADETNYQPIVSALKNRLLKEEIRIVSSWIRISLQEIENKINRDKS